MPSNNIHHLISGLLKKERSLDRPDISAGKKYVLYGAGSLGHIILELLQNKGVDILGFIDQRPFPDNRVHDVEVFPPDSDRISQLYANSDGIIVTVYNHHACLKDIVSTLKSRGYDRVYTAPDLARALPPHTLQLDYWLDLADDSFAPDQGTEKWGQTYALLADDFSRELFLELIELRVTGKYDFPGNRVHRPDLKRQYFPEDLPAKIVAERMIDCGAYDGDSVLAARQFAAPVIRAACFEPDPKNYKNLAANVHAQKGNGEIDLFPLAVWNKSEVLSFAARSNAGSAITGDHSAQEPQMKIHVQAVALDDALLSFRPSLIKMDIEGAEPEALEGAAHLIQQSRPQLAICIYHKFEHYWRIPHLIDSFKCGYRFYLRQHGFNGHETVLYALPE